MTGTLPLVPAAATAEPLMRRLGSARLAIGVVSAVCLFVSAAYFPRTAASATVLEPGTGGTMIAAQSEQFLVTREGVSEDTLERLNDAFSLEASEFAGASGSRTTRVVMPFAAAMPTTDSFGYRTFPFAGMHTGQDWAAPQGTPILAIADGVVTDTGFIAGMDGQRVEIEHQIGNETVTTISAHLVAGSQTVQVGETVSAGQVIGQVGATGAATGAHLHLDIKIGQTFVDPFQFLATFTQLDPASGYDLTKYVTAVGGFQY